MEETPIAITGIGCRFPGDIDSVEAFWEALMNGVDAVEDIPAERWRAERFHHPEKGRSFRTPQRQGGFLSNIDGFDPAFFGISPREASTLDPQQRILLEVAWEALEDAGYPLENVAGTRMGVFTGASSQDYSALQDLDSLTTHSVTGWAMCMTSNRLSYAFDLHGPSLTIDTACSSALVALHTAMLSLRRGECESALVCAVNALLHPLQHVAFSRLSMLSPTSRCHAFDSCGAGYVRNEGAGVVVLKPLEQALADGDHIYANPLVASWLESGGSKLITSRVALKALERALSVNPTQVAVMNADWALLLKTMGGKPVARFESLVARDGDEETGLQHLENLEPEERRDVLRPLLVAQVARVLGTQTHRIDCGQSLMDMGLDSLMSLQLRNWVKGTLNVTLPASALLEQPSIEELLVLLSDSIKLAATSSEVAEQDEIDTMLGAMLMDIPE